MARVTKSQYERVVRFISPAFFGGADPLGKPLAQLPDATDFFQEGDQGREAFKRSDQDQKYGRWAVRGAYTRVIQKMQLNKSQRRKRRFYIYWATEARRFDPEKERAYFWKE